MKANWSVQVVDWSLLRVDRYEDWYLNHVSTNFLQLFTSSLKLLQASMDELCAHMMTTQSFAVRLRRLGEVNL